MSTLLSSPVTAAQQQRDLLLGALVGLARSTVNEPKTEDTDHVLAAGLRLAAKPEIQAFFRKTSLQTKQKKLLYSYVLPFEMISFHRGHRALCAAQII